MLGRHAEGGEVEEETVNNPIGVIVPFRESGGTFDELVASGLSTCQLVSWDPGSWNDANADAVREEMHEKGVTPTAFWGGWTGPKVWDFLDGPQTLGIVPEEYRPGRVAELKKAGDFAERVGLPAVITHLGFIPENPKDPRFGDVVAAVREIAEHLASLGLEFWFETGQETPVTMLRLIREVGTGNLGVNLDPANLILYGKANPIDSLLVFGEYVKNIHAKDGEYPTDPMKLGHEVKVGEGRVRYPEFVKALDEVGFTGAFIIEREISGEQQKRDILDTIGYLRDLLNRT